MSQSTPSGPSVSSGKWLILGAIALLVFCGLKAWNQARDNDTPLPTKDSGVSGNPGKDPGARADDPETAEEITRRQMDDWLSDDSISKEDTARRLWALAAEVKQPESIRSEALANALLLADDPQFQKDFVPSLAAPKVWNGELADAICDNLDNRSDPVKAAAAAAMLPHASDVMKDRLRGLLRATLDTETEDDAALLQMAAKKAAEPIDSSGGQ